MFKGLKTSEGLFVGAYVVAEVITQLTSLNIIPQNLVGVAGFIATGLYAIGRGQAKRGNVSGR